MGDLRSSMLARILALTLAFGTLLLVAPAPVSPVGDASAYCIEIDGVGCFNPCMTVAHPYNLVRYTLGVEDETPDAHCPA